MSHADVPVLDLGAFERSDDRQKRELGRVIDDAFQQVGFLTVIGHGFPHVIIDDTDRVARQFFRLPLEQKLRASGPEKAGARRGYVPLGAERVTSQADLKEAFGMGRLDDLGSDPRYARAMAQYAPNVWPAEPPEFRTIFESYYAALERLTARVLEVLATALKLPQRFFQPYFTAHNCILRAQYYPALAEPPAPGQLRMGAHTDYGAITLLCVKEQQGARGLQLLNRQGAWVDMSPQDDAFIINLGDLMRTWTNDRWASTTHRVIIPDGEPRSSVDRMSLTFFANPNYDALIECMPTCLAPGETPRHAPIIAGDHRAQMFKKISAAAEN